MLEQILVDTKDGLIYIQQGNQKIVMTIEQHDRLRRHLSNARDLAKSWIEQKDPMPENKDECDCEDNCESAE